MLFKYHDYLLCAILSTFFQDYRGCYKSKERTKSMYAKVIQNPLFLVLLSIATPAGAGPGEVIFKVDSPSKSVTGLSYDGNSIWVSDHNIDQIICIDRTGKILKRLKSPGYRPAGLAFEGRHLWNVDMQKAKLYRIRISDGMVTRILPAPVSRPKAMAFDGQALWVSDDQSKSIHRVDPSDGTTISELGFPSDSVDGLAHDGTYLWVSDRLKDNLYALEPSSGEVIVTLKSPGPHPTGIVFDGSNLLISDYQTDQISAIKTRSSTHIIKDNPREIWVTYKKEIRNFGPDPVRDADIYLAAPTHGENQEILVDPIFSPSHIFKKDQWNQKVAHSRIAILHPGSSAKATMKTKAKLYRLNYVVYPENVLDVSKIPMKIQKRYLKDEPKYLLNHPTIEKAVHESVGQETNPYWIARKVYKYIHKRMHYQRIGGWDVAPKVLERGSGSCSEYSYVFISMCRKAGLPSRYVGALVVRDDDGSYDEVFHRWVEVYLPPYGWFPIDPSRGDTTNEAKRAESFGRLDNTFLITTRSGGNSELLQWEYNGNHTYQCLGRCEVDTESIAEWSPEDNTETNE